SSLKGHIKGVQEDAEGSGSIAYVPPDPKDDLQLIEALKLLRGEQANAAFPADPSKGVPN
ncbi:MAG: peptidase S41, partial [Phyllobacterium sp.]|nr:peptidase S41 [Phyllobacterium sp.]